MHARTFDWESIHRRLALTAEAISAGADRDPEQVRRILQARARAAARPAVTQNDAVRLEVLEFSLARENYCIETRYVLEVCQLKDLTAVPCTPDFVAGVMNLRGRIVAIVDLRRFFDLPDRGLTELNRVIVLAGDDSELGLLADSIHGVRSVAETDLQEGLPTLTGIRDRLLKGVTEQMLAVLDGGRLLAEAGLKVNEQVTR
jgi:purine-binding chemotaxis protein CheW